MFVAYHNHFANLDGSWGSVDGLNAENLARLLSVHVEESAVNTTPFGSSISLNRVFADDAVPIQLVSAIGHNLLPGAVVSFKLWNRAVSPSLPVWASPSVEPFIPLAGFQDDLHELLDAPVMANELEFVSIGPWDGPPTLGTLVASPVWFPPKGAKGEWSTWAKPLGQSRITPSGQAYGEEPKVIKVLSSAGFDLLEFEDAYGNAANTVFDVQQLAHAVTSTKRVVACERHDTSHALHRTALYGQCTTGIRIGPLQSGYYATERIEFEQRF